ncbi:MAG: M23 family metallopeptidase [Deltaproteobacteria bacterium]|nr:M23 family metallopeptidase [Deltaproteobacteria bacterium]
MMRFIPVFLVVLLVFSSGCRHHRGVYRGVQHGVYHTVERHQTLWRICKTYGVDMDKVARINRIKDKNKIEVGQRIFIPGAKKALKVDVYIEDVTARRRPPAVRYGKGRFIWPVEGKVTAKFVMDGQRRHDGIDICASLGTPIRAADSGRVVYSDNKMRGYGNLLIIEHKDSFFTIYAHNQANLVKEEVWVKRGEVIANVGETGNATGPHLHFEIRKGSKPLDPLRFLP